MKCESVFDEDGYYDEIDDPHDCQLDTGHQQAHECHCGVTW